jgi:hypothetical protein
MRRALAFAVLILSATFARADSGIGVNFAEAEAGTSRTDAASRGTLRLTTDVLITRAHGLQLDFGLEEDPSGTIGRIDGHLYMIPQPNQKFGLFFSVTDVDGREATVAQVGIAGMLEFAPGTVLSGHASLGMVRPQKVDFVAVSARVSHALSDGLSVFAEIGGAEFEEEFLHVVTRQTRAGLIWEPKGRPLAATLSLARSDLAGRDGRPGETRVEFAVTYRFGAKGGARRPLRERPFLAPQSAVPMIAAGIF